MPAPRARDARKPSGFPFFVASPMSVVIQSVVFQAAAIAWYVFGLHAPGGGGAIPGKFYLELKSIRKN